MKRYDRSIEKDYDKYKDRVMKRYDRSIEKDYDKYKDKDILRTLSRSTVTFQAFIQSEEETRHDIREHLLKKKNVFFRALPELPLPPPPLLSGNLYIFFGRQK